MKNLMFLSLFSVVLSLSSCSDNIVQTKDTKEEGKILLKIDTQNAPSTVVFVTASLTRDNFQTITGTLNILSDSTADILLDAVSAGEWHLKVDAENDSGLVLYTGETDVQIFAGFTTQVYLTLNPTGVGTGSINIQVTWGTQITFNWQDYINNPLLTSSHNYFDYYGIAQPIVIFDGIGYKMWYYGDGGSGHTTVCLATSLDGIQWTRYSANPVLQPSPYGNWDSEAVAPGAVILDQNIYKMYYVGWSSQSSNWNIGLATSVDGINWTKHPQPVLYGTSGWEYQIGASSIIKKDGTYFLYYYGRMLPNYKIGVATSSDGINFTKYSGNPILINQQNWESNGVLYASVIEHNSVLKMVYGNSSGSGFGLATSSDGLNWTKANNNPFFTNQNTSNNWASAKIAYPQWLKLPNESRIYYSGIGVNVSEYKIGMMRKSGN